MKSVHIFYILVFITIVLMTSFLPDSSDTASELVAIQEIEATTGENFNEMHRLPQQITSIPMKDSYTFAGEELPLQKRDVSERLDRELSVNSYWHSSTLLNIKNANRYFPVIERILREEGVPEDFKYLAVAESSLRNVTSPAGAKGLWQFMSATGKSFKLEINSNVDERYHVEKSTRAACKYLTHLKNKFGNWTLAAAAYNAGETKISKMMSEQRASNYYEMNLAAETMRYVFRIVAIKEIMSNPAGFGFTLDEAALYQPIDNYYTMEVTESIENIGEWAKQYGSDYRTIKYYNPWLRTGRLPVGVGKSYEILVPKR